MDGGPTKYILSTIKPMWMGDQPSKLYPTQNQCGLGTNQVSYIHHKTNVDWGPTKLYPPQNQCGLGTNQVRFFHHKNNVEGRPTK